MRPLEFIEGYTLYRGDHSDSKGGPGKGAELYIRNSLNHSAAPTIDKLKFDCSAWNIIKLNANRSLLVGVVYRSPSSTEENNGNLLSLLRAAAAANCQFVNICGYFNLPHIDWSIINRPVLTAVWKLKMSIHRPLISLIEELSFSQHVNTDTRFRGTQKSCLDLVLTNKEGMVTEVRELPPIGKSDHISQQWNLSVGELLFRNTAVVRHNVARQLEGPQSRFTRF